MVYFILYNWLNLVVMLVCFKGVKYFEILHEFCGPKLTTYSRFLCQILCSENVIVIDIFNVNFLLLMLMGCRGYVHHNRLHYWKFLADLLGRVTPGVIKVVKICFV